jgi:four helix bundle protein
MRCATAVGANYRAACRARSRRDFVAKLGVVEEEADECLYWLDLLRDLGAPGDAQLRMLLDESDQLCAIFVASRKTAKESLRGR